MTVLFSVFGLKVTAFAVGITVAAAAALLFLGWRCKKAGLRPGTGLTLALLILPLGLICARAFYFLARIQHYLVDGKGLGSILRFQDGGFSLWGALGGAVLAAWIAAKITRQDKGRMLDALAPSLAIFVMLERFSERFDDRLGYSIPVRTPFIQQSPLAIFNEYWYDYLLAICVIEGLAALVIFIVLLRRERKPGETIRLFFLLYSATQILFESMRRDNYPRWLFVRVYQITALAALLVMMISAVVRWSKSKSKNKIKVGKMVCLWTIFTVFVGMVILLEFSIDGKIWATLPTWGAYGIMALCCVGMGIASYQIIFKNDPSQAIPASKKL